MAAPLAVGFWVGMVQVIQSCPSAPGHCSRALGSPENTGRELSHFLPGITRLDPGTPEAAAAGHSLGFGILPWEQPQGLDMRGCPTGPELGMLLPGWLGVACCSLGCVCAHPFPELQSRIPESLTHGNIPSRARQGLEQGGKIHNNVNGESEMKN